MNRSGSSTKSMTRRSILKLPAICWLTSLIGGSAPAKALSADSAGASGSLARRTTSLNGAWSLTYGPITEYPQKSPAAAPPAEWPTIPATVPGNVELDLIAAGKLEPLEKGERVLQALKIEDHQWWYRRSFMGEAAAAGERAELVFEGLDCIATVWLNGTEVGRAANMLVAQRFDVTSALLPGKMNELVVRIDPAVMVGLAHPHSGWEFPQNGHWEGLYVRKPGHMYGWDIMPRIVSAGLWKDVYVEWLRPTRISRVYWHTNSVDVKQGRATVSVGWALEGLDGGQYKVEVALSRDGETAARYSTTSSAPSGGQTFSVEQAAFWWPRGYGERPLYDAAVTLLDRTGKIIDRRIERIGIRTIELERTDLLTADRKGKFGFTVNSVPIFAKGTDYSCLDGLHSRDHLYVDRTVRLMEEANCNMARCWGGSVYPDDRFFDLCDEAGIMVWQDFNMACAIYPRDDDFLSALDREARSVVTRLRNHPSLALWSGNNECDDAVDWAARDGGRPWSDPTLDLSTRKTIPAVLKELDPSRSYLPSSPYHSPAVVAAGNKMDSMPEVHLWGPRGYYKAEFYTSSPGLFASEIGYHGCPSRASLERMMDPEAVHPWVKGHEWNQQWLTKSCRFSHEDKTTVGRNDLMINQVKALFGECPDDLDEFILASQITQAEANKFFVELFRQQKGLKQGILWWNIRDGWPIISDAVVDYYFEKKLAFHYLQRVQRDVQAIVREEARGKHAVVVINDTLKPARGRLEVLRAGDSAKLLETAFNIEANGMATLGSLPHPTSNEMWQLKWSTEGIGAHSSHYMAFTPTISFALYKEWMKIPGLLPS